MERVPTRRLKIASCHDLRGGLNTVFVAAEVTRRTSCSHGLLRLLTSAAAEALSLDLK